MVGWEMNGEVERICKEAALDKLRHYSSSCLKNARKITRNIIHGRRCPIWNSNRVPPESKCRDILLGEAARRMRIWEISTEVEKRGRDGWKRDRSKKMKIRPKEISEESMEVWKRDLKFKLFLCLTNNALRHEGVCGSGCVDPRFLDRCSSGSSVFSFRSPPLYSKGPLGGPPPPPPPRGSARAPPGDGRRPGRGG
jgi:hypothetical protein